MPDEPIQIERSAERRLGIAVLLLVMLGFLALLAALVSAGLLMRRNQEAAAWVNHTYAVERQLAGVRLSLEQMRSARRAKIAGMALPAAADYLVADQSLRSNIAKVGRLTADNARQQRRVAELASLAGRLDRLMSESFVPGAGARPSGERELVGLARGVERLSWTMLQEEQRLLGQRQAKQERAASDFTVVLVGTAVLLLLVAVGTLLVIRRYTRDLGATRDALRALNADLEGAVRERTVDLQRANDEIQRFAYIVSHDLRSPLVNVMGFTAELEAASRTVAALIARAEEKAPDIVTQDDRLAAREDLPEAIGFIRTSTQKMDRLINAILRLSREGRRVIVPEPLDLDQIAGSVIDSLRHRTDELGGEIEVAGPLPEIVSDRLAVEQILSNLVENAVKYRHPDRAPRIAISGRRAGDRVLLAVADNGRGIDPHDHERVFDLFRRSGVQDQPGEGIGLAHVRALAYRIGGTIAVDSILGEGATFRINLPAIFAGEHGQGQAA